MDNHRVHHAKRVREWVEERKGRIELFYLPKYSPELNPYEYLKQDVKTNGVRRRKIRGYEEMEGNVGSYSLSP